MTECPSGKLSKTHLQRLFKRVFPVGDSENFCDYIFRLFDDDGNNVLEFKEFLQVSSIYFSRFSIRILLFVAVKVIIDKSHGEVSLLEQDRIENVSSQLLFFFLYFLRKKIFFLTSFYTNFLVRTLQCL